MGKGEINNHNILKLARMAAVSLLLYCSGTNANTYNLLWNSTSTSSTFSGIITFSDLGIFSPLDFDFNDTSEARFGISALVVEYEGTTFSISNGLITGLARQNNAPIDPSNTGNVVGSFSDLNFFTGGNVCPAGGPLTGVNTLTVEDCGTTEQFLLTSIVRIAISINSTTPNRQQVSSALTELFESDPDIFTELTVSLFGLDDTGLALDSLSGVQHAHAYGLVTGINQQFLQLLFNRAGSGPNTSVAFNPMQEPLFAYQGSDWPMMAASGSAGAPGNLVTNERGWWLQGFGRLGDVDDTANATGVDYHSAGAAFGIDTDWRQWLVGVAGSYSNTDADPFGGNLDIDSYQAALYASREKKAWYINTATGFGYHATDANRTIGITGSQARADYDSVTASIGAEVGKDFDMKSRITLTPYVGLIYTHTHRESFTESGAGTANLSVDDEDEDSFRTSIGVKLSRAISTGQNRQVEPYGYIAYVREHLDTNATIEAGFSAAPTTTFRIDSPDLDRDRLQGGAGVNGQLNENTSFNAGYGGEFTGSDDHHNFNATLRVAW